MEDIGRHINFNKFVEERSVEISKFLTELEMDTKKSGHQALPKSVRRRAMSHNRYRIPLRLRKNMEQELAKAERMQKLPKCRKHIRKRRHLIAAYKLRDLNKKWLSTHLWAAKRMRMVDYYGFRIAFTPNNKSFRSAYRYSRHGCTLTDISYFMALVLTHTDANQQELPLSIRLSKQKVPQCGQLIEGYILNEGKLICPGLVLRSYSALNGVVFRFFFHPAALEGIKKLKLSGGWSAALEQAQTDLYLLNGPRSLQILEEGLKQNGVIAKQQSILNRFYSHQNAAIYFGTANNFALANKPAISIPIPAQKLLTKGYNVQAGKQIRAQMMSIFNQLEVKNQNSSQITFWQIYNRGQNHQLQKTKFKVTTRSRYTHRRTNKMTKQQKREVIKAERQSESEGPRKRKHRDQSDLNNSESSITEKKIFVEEYQKKDAALEEVEPLLVGKQKNAYYVWVSNSNNCKFWRILSKLNVKVIGRRQLAHAYLQQGKLLFPQDYPTTQAFINYRKAQIINNFETYLKIPIQKRHNYLKLKSPSPFSSIIPKNPISVSLQMVSRGNCQKNSYICELLHEDLVKIEQNLSSGYVGIVHSEEGGDEPRKRYKSFQQIEADLGLVSASRKIIGSVTSGGYLYNRSREGGVGFVNESEVSQGYFSRFNNYVLVRKVSSAHYMLASVVVNRQMIF